MQRKGWQPNTAPGQGCLIWKHNAKRIPWAAANGSRTGFSFRGEWGKEEIDGDSHSTQAILATALNAARGLVAWLPWRWRVPLDLWRRIKPEQWHQVPRFKNCQRERFPKTGSCAQAHRRVQQRHRARQLRESFLLEGGLLPSKRLGTKRREAQSWT